MTRGLQRVKCQTNSRPLLNLFQIFLLVEKRASFPQAIQAEKNNLLFDIVIIIIAIALSFSSDTHCTKGCQMTKVKMHLQGWMYITLYFCHNLIIKITNYISKKVFDDDTRLRELAQNFKFSIKSARWLYTTFILSCGC